MDQDGRSNELEAQPQSLHRVAAVRVALREIAEISGPRRLQALHWALCQIGHIQEPSTYYAAVHVVVGELMHAANFAIGLRAGRQLEFPYFVDEHEAVPPAVDVDGRSLAALVLRSRQPLFTGPETIETIVSVGGIEDPGIASCHWLAAPLQRGDTSLGLMIVKDYRRAHPFTPSDAEMLAVVAEHVAAAVERRLTADALLESEARFRSLAETAPCGIVILRGDEVRFANSAMQRLTGWGADWSGRGFWPLLGEQDREAVRQAAARCMNGRDPGRCEVALEGSGNHHFAELSFGLTRDEGRPALVIVAFDVTRRRRDGELTRFLAFHDTLTGLPNRLEFQDRLEAAIARARERGGLAVVLFVDLDEFKQVNDGLGHRAGDEILRATAGRLAGAVRRGDTVARVGGDEFAIVLQDVRSTELAAGIAAEINSVLRAPFQVAGREIVVTASIGMSTFPDDGQDTDTLLRNADTAMYRVKARGRDGHQLFAPVMHASALARLDTENGLRLALERGELVLHYQPLVHLGSALVHGVEALLRWNHPQRGLVSPGEFIDAIESSRLMTPIGLWTLHTACAQARAWQAVAGPDFTVSVNLGARHFQQPELVDHVAEALASSHLAPGCLVLEITENHAMQQGEAAARTLARLHGLGVRIAIDDFGTGHSSLSYLSRLPLHCLKIDRSFVSGIGEKRGDAAIARAIVALAHELDLEVVAEGVETHQQSRFLAIHGCDLAQGFLYARPQPPDDCEAFLRQPRGVASADATRSRPALSRDTLRPNLGRVGNTA